MQIELPSGILPVLKNVAKFWKYSHQEDDLNILFGLETTFKHSICSRFFIIYPIAKVQSAIFEQRT